MAIPVGLHEGNRSEYMALFALSNLGYATPVPRQEDQVFIDLIVHLAAPEGRVFVPSGRCFAIQVKSDEAPLDFDTKRKAQTLNGLTIPYFVAVVSKQQQVLSLHTTLTRLCHMWKFGRDVPVKLSPGGEDGNVSMPDWDNHTVPLGGPIVRVSLPELDDPKSKREVRQMFYEVMSYWIKLEERALSWKELGVPLVLWQPAHTANKTPSGDLQAWVAAHPGSLPAITQAVRHDLVSFRYYLLDTLRRAHDRELPLSEETVTQLNQLKNLADSLDGLSDSVVRLIGKDLSTDRMQRSAEQIKVERITR